MIFPPRLTKSITDFSHTLNQLLAQHDEPFKSITKSVTDVSLSIIEGSLEEFRDIIVASEAAVFALPEPRVGLAALAGGLHRLPRAIGVKRAMGMILTGRRVSAAEGEALGFVNEVVPAGELMAAARRWAAQIAELSPMSIRASKEAVFKGLDEPTLEAAIRGQNRYPAVSALFTSEDFVEGPMAFSQKRAPNWKGR